MKDWTNAKDGWEADMQDSASGNCNRCQRLTLVKYIANPYEEDVNNRTMMQWLCHDCYNESADDI
jgi:hypothetical protein